MVYLNVLNILFVAQLEDEVYSMLDLKFVRENIDLVQQNLDNRHTKGDLETFVSAYEERRQLIGKVEELKALRNSVTEEISQLKRNKENADDKIAKMKKVGDEIAELDNKFAVVKNGEVEALFKTLEQAIESIIENYNLNR